MGFIIAGVEILLQHINNRLKTHKFCIVFGNELERVWPRDQKETMRRLEKIQAFAKANGLTATVHDPGLRVTFRRALPQVLAGKEPVRQSREPLLSALQPL